MPPFCCCCCWRPPEADLLWLLDCLQCFVQAAPHLKHLSRLIQLSAPHDATAQCHSLDMDVWRDFGGAEPWCANNSLLQLQSSCWLLASAATAQRLASDLLLRSRLCHVCSAVADLLVRVRTSSSSAASTRPKVK
eukprot:TRINITY_DN31269_c0_g2_i1.p1 TRINITY_DN31269_c0_g2~~TRINITY_DN31269_c0_g2_i1.p1  ORF type:complete len:135 (+),score=20.78 TRINITY_DN31269_c0_g2_i1:56-460(+)